MSIDPFDKSAGPGVYSLTVTPKSQPFQEVEMLLATSFYGVHQWPLHQYTVIRSEFAQLGFFRPEDPEQRIKIGNIPVVGQGPHVPYLRHGNYFSLEYIVDFDPQVEIDFVGPAADDSVFPNINFSEIKALKPPGFGPPTGGEGGGGEGSVRPEDGLIYPRKV